MTAPWRSSEVTTAGCWLTPSWPLLPFIRYHIPLVQDSLHTFVGLVKSYSFTALCVLFVRAAACIYSSGGGLP